MMAPAGESESRPGDGVPRPASWRLQLLAACAALGDHAVDRKNDQRANNGQQPGLQREELLQSAAEQGATDPTTEQCAYDAQHHGDDPAATLTSRKDCLSNRAGDKSENQKCNKSHLSLSSKVKEAPMFGRHFVLLAQ